MFSIGKTLILFGILMLTEVTAGQNTTVVVKTTKHTTTPPSTTPEITTRQKTTAVVKTTKHTTTLASTTPESTTAPPTPHNITSYHWDVIGKDNKTCFVGDFALRMMVSYNKNISANKTEWAQVFFDFTNNDTVKNLTSCTSNTMTIYINSVAMKQNLSLTFNTTADDSSFALVQSQISLWPGQNMFPDYTGDIKRVVASSDPMLKLMETPLNSYYKCGMESQINMVASKGENMFIYLRVAKVDKLQPNFNPSEGGAVSKASESVCFHDKPAAKPDEIKETILDASNKTCAEIQTSITLHLTYPDLANNWVNISVPVTNPKLLMAKCTQNVTWTNFQFDDDTNPMYLTMTFSKTNSSGSSWFAVPVEDYHLSAINVTYKGSNRYLQNHRDYSQLTTTSNSSLMLYESQVGYSYECRREDTQVIVSNQTSSDNMNITFNSIHWQAFAMNGSDTFGKSTFCPGPTTPAPKTTVTATTQPITPNDPVVEWFHVNDTKNNETICFSANLGLQMRIFYETNDAKHPVGEKWINFELSKNGTTSATCNANQSTVSFFNPLYKGMIFTVQFINDTKSNYLASADLTFNMTSQFWNAKLSGTTIKLSKSDMEVMKIADGSSYLCNNNETDLFLQDKNTSAIIRLTGDQWQAFGIKGTKKFANSTKCFADTRPTDAKEADWLVKNATSVCARYHMKAQAYVSYTTYVREEQIVMVPLDESKLVDADSVCGNATAGQMSVLALTMDEGKINFTLSFDSTHSANSTNSFSMNVVKFDYDPTSKYFPNHEHSITATLTNSTLDFFNTSSSKSYKCNQRVVVSFNQTLTRVDFSDVRVQPFGLTKDKNGTFSEAFDCAGDSVDDFNMLIPIIVGAILALLIVIVLVAYCIGRSRISKANEYSTI